MSGINIDERRQTYSHKDRDPVYRILGSWILGWMRAGRANELDTWKRVFKSPNPINKSLNIH